MQNNETTEWFASNTHHQSVVLSACHFNLEPLLFDIDKMLIISCSPNSKLKASSYNARTKSWYRILHYMLTSVSMTSWEKKHTRQKMRSKRSRRPALRIAMGNISMMVVITTSMATNCTAKGERVSAIPNVNVILWKKGGGGLNLTCVSKPKRMSMTKKQMDHSWGRGIMAIAWGLAMKAKPGPGNNIRVMQQDYLPVLFWQFSINNIVIYRKICIQMVMNQATHKQQSTHCHSQCQSDVFSQSFGEEDKKPSL